MTDNLIETKNRVFTSIQFWIITQRVKLDHTRYCIGMSDSGGDAGGGGGDIFEVDAGGGDGEGGDSGEEVDPFEQYRNMPSPPNTIFVFKSGGSEGSCGCPRTSSIFVETSTNLPGSLEGYLSLDEFHEITRSATKIFNETSFAICPAAICIFIICCLACCRSCASSKRRKLIEEFAAAMSHKLDAKGLTL